MKKLIVGVSDKVIMPWLEGKEYMGCSDEGEAIGIAGGYWLATGKRATVFMSADGFMNCMNAITSWVMPENIEMDLVISIGREEPPHIVATRTVEPIIELLQQNGLETKRVSIEFVLKQS